MKIAISGKGGVGKTTLAAFLAHVWKEQGKNVLAVDADPDANLAGALGFPDADRITPIADMKQLIEERTDAKAGSFGSFFKMNPKVDDLPDELAREHEGIRLMVMGTVKSGGSGCVCPESVLLKNLIQHLLVERDDAVILDMEAGIEHLGRATAFAVNLMIIVVEPGKRSIETAENIKRLAKEIGIKKIATVACKVRSEDEARFLADSLKDIPFLGYLPYSQEIIESDLKGVPPFQTAASLISSVEKIAQKIEDLINSGKG